MKKSDIPDMVLELAEKNEMLRQFTTTLNTTVTWYNKIKKTSEKVEFDLIDKELSEIDKLISTGESCLSWNGTGNNHIFIKLNFNCFKVSINKPLYLTFILSRPVI